MFLSRVDRRLATVIRLVALVLIACRCCTRATTQAALGAGSWSAVCFVVCVVAWLAVDDLAGRSTASRPTCMCSPSPAASSPAPRPTARPARSCSSRVASAGVRAELPTRVPRRRPGSCWRSRSSVLAYDGNALGLLAYALGFVATAARRLHQPPGPGPRAEPGRAAARPDAALARGAAARGAARGIDPDRARDPRRAGSHAGRPDDSARGDELADRAGRRSATPSWRACSRAHALAREGLRGDPPGGRGAARRVGVGVGRGSRRSSPTTGRAPTRPRSLRSTAIRSALTGPTGAGGAAGRPGGADERRASTLPAPACRSRSTPARHPVTTWCCSCRIAPRDGARRRRARDGLAATGGGYRPPGDARARRSCSAGRSTRGAAGGGWRVELRLPSPQVGRGPAERSDERSGARARRRRPGARARGADDAARRGARTSRPSPPPPTARRRWRCPRATVPTSC